MEKIGKNSPWLAQYIARAGSTSRRRACQLILEGRVSLNGNRVEVPMTRVEKGDVITIDGEKLLISPTRLWLYHKPKGVITSHYDPEGRETVFSLLPPSLPPVISIGRLDYNSEGLLLLTNNGEFSKFFTDPTRKWLRVYRIRAYGVMTHSIISLLQKGVTVEGVHYAPLQAKWDMPDITHTCNHWMTLGLTEGKNREIRIIMEYFGLEVNRLIRTNYGPFSLGKLAVNTVEEVPEDYIPSFNSH